MTKLTKDYKNKLDFIFESVKKSGTKNSIKQFVYTIEEVGEIAECPRVMDGDSRKNNKDKEDLGSEIGDLLITLFLITKFENLDFFKILDNVINKEYYRWKSKYIDDKEEIEENENILPTKEFIEKPSFEEELSKMSELSSKIRKEIIEEIKTKEKSLLDKLKTIYLNIQDYKSTWTLEEYKQKLKYTLNEMSNILKNK
ncbi:MAG: MazG nucleotide pyrophosphohydrolase domain-containing protein [Candidatus Thorarchaeota archaeon]